MIALGIWKSMCRGPHVRDHDFTAEIKEVACNRSTEWRDGEM